MKSLAPLAGLVALVAAVASAQPPGPPPRPEGPRPDPVLALFDADGDGRLSAAEIDAAPGVLKALDRDGDGAVARNELPRPPRPGEGPAAPMRGDRGGEASADPATLPAGTLVFRGGHETDPRDNGRPVALIAAALGVTPEVFRDAFSRVRPARGGGGPTAAEAEANKAALMAALGPHGITNERLDEVSNTYRYRPEAGELWTHRPAAGTAIVRDGRVVGVSISDPGAGYTSPPEITVVGHPGVRLTATVEFSTDLERNGGLTKFEPAK